MEGDVFLLTEMEHPEDFSSTQEMAMAMAMGLGLVVETGLLGLLDPVELLFPNHQLPFPPLMMMMIMRMMIPQENRIKWSTPSL